MKNIWEKIKVWFLKFDYNKDGVFNSTDVKQAVNDAVDDVNAVVQEVKTETSRRVQRVKEEVKDVLKATKEVGSQASDVVDAIKGKVRRGRPTEEKPAAKKATVAKKKPAAKKK